MWGTNFVFSLLQQHDGPSLSPRQPCFVGVGAKGSWGKRVHSARLMAYLTQGKSECLGEIHMEGQGFEKSDAVF